MFSRIEFLKDTFPGIKFFEMEENTPSYNHISEVLMSRIFESARSKSLRSFFKGSYTFGYEYIFLNYRIPLNNENLKSLRRVILDGEGVLMASEKELEITETA